MDAVELPLPTPVVSKLLVAEAFGRVRETEGRDSAAVSSVGGGGASASPFSSQKASSSCGSFHRDVKYPISVIEHDPISRNKKNIDGLLGNVPTTSKQKEIGPKLCSREDDLSLRSWPKYDSKQLHKKLVKRRSSPKQARTDHPDVSMNSQTIKSCTGDKSRVVKHRHRQESKRSDRKTMRTTVKAKFDSFMSKDSLVNSHLGVTGNNIFGTFGVKFDLDVTKNVDELSLSELLDGNYKCPNLCHDKGKKASNANENILLSVRKAASILTNPGTGSSNGSRKAPCIPTSTDCDEEEAKYVEESAFSSEIQDQASVSDSTLYQPKDILERLALPAAQDLKSILVDSCSPIAPLKSTTSVGKASLPPFPWSFSHSGSCKPLIDSGKSSTTKSTSQGRWVRIGSSSCLVGEERSCLPELDLKIDDHTGDSKHQHFGDNSLSLETLKLHNNLPYSVQNCMPQDANAITKPINMSDISTSKRSSNSLSSYGPYNPVAANMDSSNVYQLGFKESAVVTGMKTEGIFQHKRNEQIQEISYTEVEDTMKDVWDHNGKNYSSPSNSTVGVSKQCSSHSSIPGGSNSDYSPRLLAAAAILCDIASTRKRNHKTGKAIWPNIPSQTAMKARKPRPFIGKTDGPKLAAKASDPTKRTNRMTSPECKPVVGDDRSKTVCISNVGRGPVRWPAPAENAYSTKVGRDLVVKPVQSSPTGIMGQTPLLTRTERGCDGHRKHRSAAVMTASVSTSAAIYVKDWGKGRHRRE